MRIYLDCDGVLADYVGEANDWLGLPRNKPWTKWEGDGIDWEKLNESMTFVSFWQDMQELPGAKKLYNNLKKLGKVYICTRPFRDPNCLYARSKWLWEKLGISITDTIYMHDKYLLAKPNTILIDDNVENVRLFAEQGGYSILYPATYNSKIVSPNKVEETLNKVLQITKRQIDG